MILNLNDLKDKKVTELHAMAKEMGIENAAGLRTQELIFAIFVETHSATLLLHVSVFAFACCMIKIFDC